MNMFRTGYAFIFLGCATLTAISFYFQYALYLDPCPLCVVQRIIVIVIGITAVMAVLHNPLSRGGKLPYCCLGLCFSLFGSAIATRHVYLQSLPVDQIPECLPGIEFILQNNPLIDALSIILAGTGECAETLWEFMGISIPGWTLIAFCVFAAIQIVLLIKIRRHGSV